MGGGGAICLLQTVNIRYVTGIYILPTEFEMT